MPKLLMIALMGLGPLLTAKSKIDKSKTDDMVMIECTISNFNSANKVKTTRKMVKAQISENGPSYRGYLKTGVGEISITDEFSSGKSVIELSYGPGKYNVSGHPLTIISEGKHIKDECQRSK